MKKIMLSMVALTVTLFCQNSHAQFGKLKEKLKQKIDQRMDQKTDKAIDKTLDDTEKKVENTNDPKESDSPGATQTKSTGGLKSYSKFDFVPGDKIVYAEDFAQDVIGEFPLKWDTRGSGEIVTIDHLPGKWLQMQEATSYVSPLKSKFPENATVEFDLLVDFKDDQRVPAILIDMFSPKGTTDQGELAEKISGLRLSLFPNAGSSQDPDQVELLSFDNTGKRFFDPTNRSNTDVFNALNKKSIPVHVACWIQKQRVRVWLNEKKLYDLPRALAPNTDISNLRFAVGSYGGSKENFQYYVSNIKVAVASPDTRSKLITEGRWSTSGILFNVNSDKIQPVSAGVLKDIAAVLTENPTVKIRIIGHTDNDGEETKNLELSKRRAAAVKRTLAADYGIEESRMLTDGMGESKPVADNNKPEGKAQNRRVEFIKL